MSEWLGRPYLEPEDVKEFQPHIYKYYPLVIRYFVEDQKPRVVLPIPYDIFDRLKEVLIKDKKYGKITPTMVRKAMLEALTDWLEKKEK